LLRHIDHRDQGVPMNPLSRRTFLRSGSAAVVAETQGPADAATAETAAADTESATLTEPLVAHIRDLSTGEIGLFSGTREISLFDPQLAARLAQAIR
jgi:hypothetical protein